MTWQKKARLVIAVFIVGFVTIVVVALRRPKPEAEPEKVPERTDEKTIAEIKGALTYAYTRNNKIVFTVNSDGQLLYQDGRSVYKDATLSLPERNGRAVTVRADRAEVLGKQGATVGTADLKGNVRLTTNDGVTITTSEARYSDDDGMLNVPGPVAFTRGRMRGTGVGATYDRNREVLWLLKDAHIYVGADPKGQGAMEATAGSAGLARQDHYARLLNGGRITTADRVVSADDITIRFSDDGERVQMLELRANSRITGSGGGAQAMSARDIDLTYAEDGRSLQFAKLVDEAVVQLPGAGSSPGRRVSARAIDMAMSPDGVTVTNLNANENVQVDLPAEGDIPARRIRSATLIAAGAPGMGLQSANFNGGVDYRETRAARGRSPAGLRTARSLRLNTETSPGLGVIKQADFRGNVRITDGSSVVAESSRVIYDVAADRMDLSPGEGDSGPDAQVTDDRVMVRARTIQFTPATRKMQAETDVRSTWLAKSGRTAAPAPATKPAAATASAPPPPPGRGTQAGRGRGTPAAPAPPPAAAPPDGRMPALLKDNEPVNVASNRLDYDGSTGLATYSGNARLWQGTTSIKAGTLILDDKNGNLSGQEKVITDMMMSEVDAKTNQKKESPTTGRGETFVYDDAGRVATYTTGARIADARGARDLTADKIELFLAPKASEVQRLEAYGAVTVKEPARTASGTRLTYTAEDDKYVMTGTVGTPVIVVEQKPGGGCQKSQGTRLVFRQAVEGFTLDEMKHINPCTAGPAR